MLLLCLIMSYQIYHAGLRSRVLCTQTTFCFRLANVYMQAFTQQSGYLISKSAHKSDYLMCIWSNQPSMGDLKLYQMGSVQSILVVFRDWSSRLKCVDRRKQCECWWCYHAWQRWFCVWNQCYKHCKYQVPKLL